jgi:hypothetical protein
MLKLKPSQQSELDSLMTKEEYDRFVGEERDKENKESGVANKPSQADQDQD